MKDKVIGLIWRFGKNDYQISLTQYDDKDQEVLQDIETRYGDADRYSCVRGDENLTIKDANIEYWESEWSKGERKRLRTFMLDGYYKTRLPIHQGITRKETVFKYINKETLELDNVEYWGTKDYEKHYYKIGSWANECYKHLSTDSFDVVIIIDKGKVIEFWYVDKIGTIKKVYL